MQVASLHTSIVLESASFLVPLRDVTSEVEKSSRKMEQEQNRLARSADRLLSSLDPVYAAQSRFSKGMEEAGRLLKAGAISAEQFASVESALKGRLEQTTAALRAYSGMSAHAQQRMRLLGYQIADVGVQLAGGQNPFMIIAQQVPQMANALDGAKGIIGKFASFLSGPLGASLLAAGTVFGMFALKMRESMTASEEHERTSKTLKQAIEELDRVSGLHNKTLERQIQLGREALEDKRRQIEENIRLAESYIASAEAQMASPSSKGGLEINAGMRALIEQSRQRIKELEGQLDRIDRSIRGSRSALLKQEVDERLDALTKARNDYERAVKALDERLAAGEISDAQYTRDYEKLTRDYKAQTEAIQEATRAAEKAGRAQEKAARDWERAVDSRIQSLLKERTAMAQYAKDMKILQESLSRGTISAMERDIAANRARQEWLDGLALKRLEPKIMDSSAAKLALPKVNMRELANLDSVRATREEIERTAERARQLDQAAMQFATNMSSSFEDAIFAGKGLRSVLSGLLDDLGKMVIRLTVIEPLARSVADALKGGRLGGGGGIFGLIGGLFGGARANGGPVTAGRAYLVGERGPELLMPATSGTIIPNGALQGMAAGGRNITIHVDARDAVLASTVRQWVQEAVALGTAGGSALAQQSMARRARRQIS